MNHKRLRKPKYSVIKNDLNPSKTNNVEVNKRDQVKVKEGEVDVKTNTCTVLLTIIESSNTLKQVKRGQKKRQKVTPIKDNQTKGQVTDTV